MFIWLSAAHLLCIDVSKQAVQLASQRLEAFEHVTVENRKIPEDFYEQKFDLIVISEVAYYLTFDELGEFIEQLKQALNPEGEILCCHWRHDIQDFELNAQKSIKAFNNLFHFITI